MSLLALRLLMIGLPDLASMLSVNTEMTSAMLRNQASFSASQRERTCLVSNSLMVLMFDFDMNLIATYACLAGVSGYFVA